MFACIMNRIINLDVNNMHKQASRVVIVVLGFVFLHPTGLAVFESDVRREHLAKRDVDTFFGME